MTAIEILRGVGATSRDLHRAAKILTGTGFADAAQAAKTLAARLERRR